MNIDTLIDDFIKYTKINMSNCSIGYGISNLKEQIPGIVINFYDVVSMNNTKLPETYKGYPVYVKLSKIPAAQ